MFIIPAIEGGGSERVLVNLLNSLDSDFFEISLCVLKESPTRSWQIPVYVDVYEYKFSSVSKSVFTLYRLIRKVKPDIVFSTLGHLNLLISCLIFFLPRKMKFVARESNTLSVHNKNEKYPILFNILFSTTYKLFDRIIAQSAYMKNDMITNFGIKSERVVQIYNPVDERNMNIDGLFNVSYDESRTNIVLVGRLNYQKRIEDAIELIGLLGNKYVLHILGDGEDKEQLELLIGKLSLSNQVVLHGFISNPYPYIFKANCLISTSRYEGLPNVVIESLVLGTPVIAYDCPGGTRELIDNGGNGFLVEDGNVQMLRSAVEKACDIEWDREQIKESALRRFSSSVIVPQYEKLFKELVRR